MKSARRFLGSKLLPGILILLGGLAMWAAIGNVLDGWSSDDWPYVEGVITASEVSSSSQSMGSSTRSRTSTSYFPSVEYQYTVNGAPQEGYEIVFGGYSFSSRQEAGAILQKYPLGQKVRVYYKPRKYHRSVLEPGLHGLPYILLFGGTIFVGAGFLMIKLFPKK